MRSREGAVELLEVASSVALRPARDADTEAIAALWHQAWLDAHAALVPAAAVAQRPLSSFQKRVPERLAETTLATTGARLVGFVTVRGDNVEQLYVAEAARGSGVGQALLAHAESQVALRFDRAWLTVASGNTRARRFYARHGWRDVGGVDFPLPTADGSVVVRARRYEKWLTPA